MWVALTWHESACNLCYINCGVELSVGDDGTGSGATQRIAKVRGDGPRGNAMAPELFALNRAVSGP